MDARVDFSVRSPKLLTVCVHLPEVYVTALYPPLQLYFPLASICQKVSEPPLISKDSLVVREV